MFKNALHSSVCNCKNAEVIHSSSLVVVPLLNEINCAYPYNGIAHTVNRYLRPYKGKPHKHTAASKKETPEEMYGMTSFIDLLKT